MVNIRTLNKDEINEAARVFGSTIKYENIYIQEYGDGAQTWAYNRGAWDWYYVIFWSSDVYTRGAINAGKARTLIHELTHVWQGHYGTFPREYMIKSGLSQTFEGVFKDAWDKGWDELKKRINKLGWKDTWHSYRNRAYAFSMNNIGVNNWNDFNVEQQAGIVESWYAPNTIENYLGEKIPGGNMSIKDSRYPYITCNILAGAPNAQYTPLSVPAAPQLGIGADAKIKAIQDILVRLGYLDPKYANGIMGKFTREAVRGFQRNNGLKVDGDIGGPNSETRKKLGVR